MSKPELKPNFPYRLETPRERYILPAALQEVSGVTWVDSITIACIEDNFGDIYLYDINTKSLKKVFKFEGPGDFEGITKVNNLYYAVRSDGTIFQSDGSNTKRFDNFLKGKNNVEGLCYDSLNNRLLLALKGKPTSKEKDTKEVLAFDLKSKKLEKEPVFKIHLKQFEPFLGELADRLKFKPSAINIHPLSGDIYILSSTAQAMIKTNFEGEVKDMAWLNEHLYEQPEGICFAPDGTMFISNEGKKGQPDILKFKYYSE